MQASVLARYARDNFNSLMWLNFMIFLFVEICYITYSVASFFLCLSSILLFYFLYCLERHRFASHTFDKFYPIAFRWRKSKVVCDWSDACTVTVWQRLWKLHSSKARSLTIEIQFTAFYVRMNTLKKSNIATKHIYTLYWNKIHMKCNT